MATIRRFEDLQAWQKARHLTGQIYAISNQGSFSKDFSLRDQIRRASVSIMSNIAEGFKRGGTRELLQFLAMAKGSTGEVRSQLYVAVDQHYIAGETSDRLFKVAISTSQVVGGLMNYLQKSGLKGSKYK